MTPLHRKLSTVDPVNNAVIPNSRTVKVTFNENIKAGTPWIELKNSQGKVYSTKNTISGKTLSITPTTALPSGYKYNLVLHSNSIKDLTGNGISAYSTQFYSISNYTGSNEGRSGKSTGILQQQLQIT